ncbi:hypothetical protein HOE67_04030 [Candidatus Peregrinibacteria bacterium]|jgi:hypothetical protein|nr:hypothetical protein [Candidatus Peregrinibacteria bacterium]MBT4056254.1 hypothetical protein [Candidatus Peregrinibacteria bacterium]
MGEAEALQTGSNFKDIIKDPLSEEVLGIQINEEILTVLDSQRDQIQTALAQEEDSDLPDLERTMIRIIHEYNQREIAPTRIAIQKSLRERGIAISQKQTNKAVAMLKAKLRASPTGIIKDIISETGLGLERGHYIRMKNAEEEDRLEHLEAIEFPPNPNTQSPLERKILGKSIAISQNYIKSRWNGLFAAICKVAKRAVAKNSGFTAQHVLAEYIKNHEKKDGTITISDCQRELGRLQRISSKPTFTSKHKFKIAKNADSVFTTELTEEIPTYEDFFKNNNPIEKPEAQELDTRVSQALKHVIKGRGAKPQSQKAVEYALTQVMLPAAQKNRYLTIPELVRATNKILARKKTLSGNEKPLSQKTIVRAIERIKSLNETIGEALGFTIAEQGAGKKNHKEFKLQLTNEFQPENKTILQIPPISIDLPNQPTFNKIYFNRVVKRWACTSERKNRDSIKALKFLAEQTAQSKGTPISEIEKHLSINPESVTNTSSSLLTLMKFVVDTLDGVEIRKEQGNYYYLETPQHKNNTQLSAERPLTPSQEISKEDLERELATRINHRPQAEFSKLDQALVQRILTIAFSKYINGEAIETSDIDQTDSHYSKLRAFVKKIQTIDANFPTFLGFYFEDIAPGIHMLRASRQYIPSLYSNRLGVSPYLLPIRENLRLDQEKADRAIEIVRRKYSKNRATTLKIFEAMVKISMSGWASPRHGLEECVGEGQMEHMQLMLKKYPDIGLEVKQYKHGTWYLESTKESEDEGKVKHPKPKKLGQYDSNAITLEEVKTGQALLKSISSNLEIITQTDFIDEKKRLSIEDIDLDTVYSFISRASGIQKKEIQKQLAPQFMSLRDVKTSAVWTVTWTEGETMFTIKSNQVLSACEFTAQICINKPTRILDRERLDQEGIVITASDIERDPSITERYMVEKIIIELRPQKAHRRTNTPQAADPEVLAFIRELDQQSKKTTKTETPTPAPEDPENTENPEIVEEEPKPPETKAELEKAIAEIEDQSSIILEAFEDDNPDEYFDHQ